MGHKENKAGLSLRLLKLYFRTRGIFRRLFKLEKTVYAWHRYDYYKKMWREGAQEMGADFRELDNNTWEVVQDGKSARISGWLVELDNPVTLRIAGNKILSYRLLADADLEVPPHAIFNINSLGIVKEFMGKHKGLYVIKPATGTSSGRGVTTHIKTFGEARKAAALAAGYGSEKLLIELLIPGEVYRLLYLGGELLFASRRNGIWLNGDGKSTIAEQITIENKARMNNTEHPKSSINIDLDVEATLDSQNLTLNSVIDAGRQVLIKSADKSMVDTEEIRTVYDENVTHLLCDQLQKEGARAARAVRSNFVGVDIITRDMTVGLKEGGGIIGEVNTTPGMHHHTNLKNSDKTPSAVPRVLRYLLQQRQSNI